MKQVTATGQSVKEAVDSALKQLNATLDQVNIVTIDEGKKGFLGIGSRLAIVKVSLKNESALERLERETSEPKVQEKAKEEKVVFKPKTETKISNVEIKSEGIKEKEQLVQQIVINEESQKLAIDKTKEFVLDVAKNMGVLIDIEVSINGKFVTLKMSGEKIALLIGKRGQVLNSLQYLAQLVANQHSEQFMTILLDAEDYRKRRTETLESLAFKMADRALYTKKEVALEPMPSYERKVIHAALMNKKKIKTYSNGTEPYRHIVIAPDFSK
ncbi:MAG: protein jag [Bacillales bacterium]|jgi:spoIIIJ-associated protein|nr:protein jag [Bacillales bacterium]